MAGSDAMDDEGLHLMEHAFIDGFRSAPDKQAFLLMAGIPYALDRGDAPGLKLVEVRIDETFEVGSVGRGFGSSDLVHNALPAEMIARRSDLKFVYVAADELRVVTFADIRRRESDA